MKIGHCYITRTDGILLKILDKNEEGCYYCETVMAFRNAIVFLNSGRYCDFDDTYYEIKISLYNQIKELWLKSYRTINEIRKEFVPTQTCCEVGIVMMRHIEINYIDEIIGNDCYTWFMELADNRAFIDPSRAKNSKSDFSDGWECYSDPSHALDKLKKALDLVCTTMNLMQKRLYYQYVPKGKRTENYLTI